MVLNNSLAFVTIIVALLTCVEHLATAVDIFDIEMVEKINFDNVLMSKKIVFTENTSLVEDIIKLDQLYAHEVEQQKKMNASLNSTVSTSTVSTSTTTTTTFNASYSIELNNSDITYVPKSSFNSNNGRHSEKKKEEKIVYNFNDLEMRILMIGDHSIYENFLKMYDGDDFVAYNTLYQYLNAIFDQISTIFYRIFFFDKYRITLRLAGITPIFRAEDCPFRSHVLAREMHQEEIKLRRALFKILITTTSSINSWNMTSKLAATTTTLESIRMSLIPPPKISIPLKATTKAAKVTTTTTHKSLGPGILNIRKNKKTTLKKQLVADRNNNEIKLQKLDGSLIAGQNATSMDQELFSTEKDVPLRATSVNVTNFNETLNITSTTINNDNDNDNDNDNSNDNDKDINGKHDQHDEFMDFSKIEWTKIQGLTAIHAVHSWMEQNAIHFPAYDHAIVITRYDLMTPNNDSATQGMAYVRAMCRGSDSASVVEDIGGLTTAAIAAHEIVHSLGAFHDGSGPNTNCSSSNNFLMSPSSSGSESSATFSNAFHLSECSLRNIEDFLNSSEANCLRRKFRSNAGNDQMKIPKTTNTKNIHDNRQDTNEPFGGKNGTIRTMETVGDVKNYSNVQQTSESDRKIPHKFYSLDISNKIDDTNIARPQQQTLINKVALNMMQKPGELFDANKQCKIAFGLHYGLCQKRDYHHHHLLRPIAGLPLIPPPTINTIDPCRRLWCKNRKLRRSASCETKSFLPLMDGTKCGESQWCVSGACVHRSSSLLSEVTLNECQNLNESYCNNLPESQRSTFCMSKTFQKLCCVMCSLISSSTLKNQARKTTQINNKSNSITSILLGDL